MNTNTVYKKEQGGKYVEIDGAEFPSIGLNITAMIDECIRKMRDNAHSGYIRFKVDGEVCHLTHNRIEIDVNGMPVRNKIDCNNIKVCLMPNGNIKLFRASDDRLVCNMGDCPEVSWREYRRV